jgi:hypothetical protein
LKGRVALWIWAIIATGIAACFLIFPLQAYFVREFVLHVINKNRHPPRIVEGHISDDDWRDKRGASRKFTILLQEKFPAGTDESLLKSELLKEGFNPLSSQGRIQCQVPIQTKRIGWVSATCTYPATVLEYHWSGPLIDICGDDLFVSWSIDDGAKIVRIEGEYNR